MCGGLGNHMQPWLKSCKQSKENIFVENWTFLPITYIETAILRTHKYISTIYFTIFPFSVSGVNRFKKIYFWLRYIREQISV